MVEKRKRKVKRKRQRVRRVWAADEWLSKVDWGRFGPANPKRQAWEIIRRLADVTGRPAVSTEGDPTPGAGGGASWVDRVRG